MKLLPLLLCVLAATGCMAQYPMTTFYVKNNSDRTINFKASVMKYTSTGMQFEVTAPYAVPPHDSVVARKVRLRKDAPPNIWFTRFSIFPADGVSFNDPNIPENWIRSTDAKGKPAYTFTLTK